MKTVVVSNGKPSLQELLTMTRTEGTLICEDNGDKFLLTLADEFETEVQLLSRSHKFIAFLGERMKSDKTIPIEQVEAELLGSDESSMER